MHTPGPWKIANSPAPDQGEWHYWSVVGERGVITSIGAAQQRGPIDMDSNRANAKLIAAAPDLLDALEAIIDDMGDDGLCTCEHNKRKAVDAYEKATGRRVPT